MSCPVGRYSSFWSGCAKTVKINSLLHFSTSLSCFLSSEWQNNKKNLVHKNLRQNYVRLITPTITCEYPFVRERITKQCCGIFKLHRTFILFSAHMGETIFFAKLVYTLERLASFDLRLALVFVSIANTSHFTIIYMVHKHTQTLKHSVFLLESLVVVVCVWCWVLKKRMVWLDI